MKTTRKLLLFIFLMGSITSSFTQQMLVEQVHIHQGNGEHIETGFLLVQDGKIKEIGSGTYIGSKEGLILIDGSGKHIYPGVIALNTQLGLKEIDAVRATRDFDEVGRYNPNLRSIIAYNTDSEVVKTVRSAGILFAQISPQGGIISGRSSVVKLEAWNWEDAAVVLEDGMHLNWPSTYIKRGWWADPKSPKENDKYEQAVREIESYFESSSSQCLSDQEQVDLKKNGLCTVIQGKMSLYIHVNESKAMIDALAFCNRWDIRPIFYGARDAMNISELLKEHEAILVLKRVKSLPSRIDQHILSSYELPAALHRAEIPFAIADNGSWQQRNLIYQASQAIAHGLPYEEAVRAITLNPATILGIGEERGSLEVNKSADFILLSGDLFEIGSSMVERAFIEGVELDLTDKQKVLYEKYREKYGL